MDKKHIEIIMNDIDRLGGYSEKHKSWLYEFMQTLHFNYSHTAIDKNSSILPIVDRLMQQYERFNPVACTWRDVGPEPFGGDFMAANLDDYDDMFVVLINPVDHIKILGIHVFKELEEMCFELNQASRDEENYILEEELFDSVDKIVADWDTES